MCIDPKYFGGMKRKEKGWEAVLTLAPTTCKQGTMFLVFLVARESINSSAALSHKWQTVNGLFTWILFGAATEKTTANPGMCNISHSDNNPRVSHSTPEGDGASSRTRAKFSLIHASKAACFTCVSISWMVSKSTISLACLGCGLSVRDGPNVGAWSWKKSLFAKILLP